MIFPNYFSQKLKLENYFRMRKVTISVYKRIIAIGHFIA